MMVAVQRNQFEEIATRTAVQQEGRTDGRAQKDPVIAGGSGWKATTEMAPPLIQWYSCTSDDVEKEAEAKRGNVMMMSSSTMTLCRRSRFQTPVRGRRRMLRSKSQALRNQPQKSHGQRGERSRLGLIRQR